MSYVSTVDIQNALDTQLQTVANLPGFFAENQYVPQSGVTPFCRSTLGPAKSIIEGIGVPRIILQQGLYAVDLFYPIDYGYSAGRTMADAVINAFQPGFLSLADGNKLIILTAWSQPSHNDANSFLQYPVRVEWWIRTQV